MSIPNVSTLYQRLKKGSEGGREFARIIDLLLLADSKENNYPFVTFDDDMGDAFGVDSFGGTGYRDTKGVIGYQYKFFPSPLSAQHRNSIKSSLENAIERSSDLRRWILVTPEDFFKPDVEWFEELGRKYLRSRDSLLFLEHWGHKNIIELMLRFPHVAKHYYPELFLAPGNDITIANIKMDTDECDWYKPLFTNHIRHQYMPYFMKFIKINDYVIHFGKLEPEVREMFERICFYVQNRLAGLTDLTRRLPEASTFLQIGPATFYKSLILLNRLGGSLESFGEIYDVRGSDFFGEEYNDEFYVYDIKAVKAVGRILPLVWPDAEEFEKESKNQPLGEHLKEFKHGFMRTTNPIFDITLVNNTPVTQVLHRIDIIIERIWSEIKAGPLPQVLKPIMTYRFNLDFSKKENSFELDAPISFGAEQPVRFKVQFEKFINNCPGNCAEIRFRFGCNNDLIESEVLFLDF